MDSNWMEEKTRTAQKDLARHGDAEPGGWRNDVGGGQDSCGGQSDVEELCRPMHYKCVEGLRSKVRLVVAYLLAHLEVSLIVADGYWS